MNALLVALTLLLPQQNATPAPPPLALDKAAIAVQEQISDLALLQSLAPLKLTAAQIDKLLPSLKKARARAVELNRQDDEALARISPEVTKAREQALKGEGVPETIEKTVREVQRLAASRRLEATRTTVKDVLESFRELLTDSQKSEIEKQSEKLFGGKRVPKEYAKDPGKAPKEVVQDLALSAFIERVLLFDRAFTLLEKLKAAPKPE